ncbi:hypothetical protein M0802_011183 [Mischocyttarus mexicanus]|nr:hypothetical protein M0802_011183 [Mischocyttarus mexicanus]
MRLRLNKRIEVRLRVVMRVIRVGPDKRTTHFGLTTDDTCTTLTVTFSTTGDHLTPEENVQGLRGLLYLNLRLSSSPCHDFIDPVFYYNARTSVHSPNKHCRRGGGGGGGKEKDENENEEEEEEEESPV